MRGPIAVPTLLVVLLAATAFSGCLSDSSSVPTTFGTATAEPKPTGKVNQTKIPLPPGANPDFGAIRGDVTSIRGGVIKKARVLILGMERQTEGNEVGGFAFNDVPAGTYKLRAEAKAYLAAEVEISVETGWLTLANISLEPEDPNSLEHVHDYWFDFGGTGLPVVKRTLFNEPVDFPWSLTQGGERTTSACVRVNAAGTSSWGEAICSIPIILEGEGPEHGIVWSGTKQLDVTVNWTGAHNYVRNLRFEYQPANTSQFTSLEMIRGEPKSIEVKPEVKADGKVVEMADNGHARWSKWRFRLQFEFYATEDVILNNGDLIRLLVGPFSVSMIAHKGALPVEPTHPRPWLNGPEIIVVENLTRKVGVDGGPATKKLRPPPPPSVVPVTVRDRNATRDGDEIAFTLPANRIIPAGTTRVKVTLEYADLVLNTTGQSVMKRSLSFRTAGVNPATAKLTDMKTYGHTADWGKSEWSFKLEDPKDETDPVYAAKSSWMFLLANEGKEYDQKYINECSGKSTCGGTFFKLKVVAINEKWQEEFDAGLI